MWTRICWLRLRLEERELVVSEQPVEMPESFEDVEPFVDAVDVDGPEGDPDEVQVPMEVSNDG